MIRKTNQGLIWLEFELLQGIRGLVHGVFLRHGGVSAAPYASLNLSFSSGDAQEAVACNRTKIEQLMGSPLIAMSQMHTNRIARIDALASPQGEYDALLTQTKGIGLLATHADCQAAIFYDPIHHAVANVHCGWRGQVQNIYKETLAAMKAQFGSQPEELLVCISPSLGPQAAEFKNFREELPPSFWDFQERPTYFNLWKIAKAQLTKEGVLPHHIEIAALCTRTQSEDFFSYRRENKTGRNGTVAVLK